MSDAQAFCLAMTVIVIDSLMLADVPTKLSIRTVTDGVVSGTLYVVNVRVDISKRLAYDSYAIVIH